MISGLEGILISWNTALSLVVLVLVIERILR